MSAPCDPHPLLQNSGRNWWNSKKNYEISKKYVSQPGRGGMAFGQRNRNPFVEQVICKLQKNSPKKILRKQADFCSDILHFVTFYVSWHFTFHDIWHFMIFDISRHLTFYDICYFISFYISWHFTFEISWHLTVHNICYFMTFHDILHFTFHDILHFTFHNILHFMTFYIS